MNLNLFVVPSPGPSPSVYIPATSDSSVTTLIIQHLLNLASVSQLCLVGLSLECFFSLLRHCLVCVDM